MEGLNAVSIELYESEAKFLKFNEKVAQIPFVTDPVEGLGACMESMESRVFGKETQSLKAALDMWNQVPQFNLRMYPDTCGYASEGLALKRPSFGACRSTSLEKERRMHQVQ